MRYKVWNKEMPIELEGIATTNGLTYLTNPPFVFIDFSEKEKVDNILANLNLKFEPCEVSKKEMDWYFRCSKCFYKSQQEKEYTLLEIPKKNKSYRLCFDCYRKFINFMEELNF